jgi:hypothetical protein
MLATRGSASVWQGSPSGMHAGGTQVLPTHVPCWHTPQSIVPPHVSGSCPQLSVGQSATVSGLQHLQSFVQIEPVSGQSVATVSHSSPSSLISLPHSGGGQRHVWSLHWPGQFESAVPSHCSLC